MLNEFIYKILVHERDYKGRPDSPQTIEIYFNFIGKFEMPREEHIPSPEEIELAERKERIRQKRHEEYLRRKSTGWQSTYYWKNKRARKEALDAKKEWRLFFVRVQEKVAIELIQNIEFSSELWYNQQTLECVSIKGD